jgi:hypothetical protein
VIDLTPVYYNYGGGSLNIAADGTLSLLGAADIVNSGIINNDGLISGHGTIAGPSLANNGAVLAIGGLLTIDGSISGSGTFEVGAGGTLDINGTITEAMTVPLAGSVTAFAGTAGGLEQFAASGVVDPKDLVPAHGGSRSGALPGAAGAAALDQQRPTGAAGLVGAALDRDSGARSGGHDGIPIAVHLQ